MTSSSSSLSSSRNSLIGGDERSTPTTIITDGVIDAYRDVKKYSSAAFAGVRLLLSERGMRKFKDEEIIRVRSSRKRRHQEQFQRRDDDNSGDSGSASDNANNNNDNDSNDDYDNNDSYLSSHDDNNHNNFNNEEQDDESSFEEVIQRIRRQKTHSALLSAHQMEALWKITKIELDRTVRDAVDLSCVIMEIIIT